MDLYLPRVFRKAQTQQSKLPVRGNMEEQETSLTALGNVRDYRSWHLAQK